jgi:anti-sigma-K factor RskA
MVSAELPNNWQELIAGYVLGNLDEEEMRIVEHWLAQRPELWQDVEATEAAFQSIAELAPPRQPPASLRDRILFQAAPPPKRIRPVWLVGLGSAIAAGTVLLLGWRNATLNTQLQQANTQIETLERNLQQAQLQAQTVRPVLNTLQQPGTLVYTLQGSDRANTASGSLVMSAQQNTVIILVQNLPELPSGKVYRLWAKPPSASSLAYCGQFNINDQGLVKLTPSASICEAKPTQMLITVDAITDPTTKGGPVIMQSQI